MNFEKQLEDAIKKIKYRYIEHEFDKKTKKTSEVKVFDYLGRDILKMKLDLGAKFQDDPQLATIAILSGITIKDHYKNKNSLDKLRREHFSARVRSALEVLDTIRVRFRTPSEFNLAEYLDYIHFVTTNRDALLVKMKELEYKMDMDNFLYLSDEAIDRLMQKVDLYKQAYEILSASDKEYRVKLKKKEIEKKNKKETRGRKRGVQTTPIRIPISVNDKINQYSKELNMDKYIFLENAVDHYLEEFV